MSKQRPFLPLVPAPLRVLSLTVLPWLSLHALLILFSFSFFCSRIPASRQSGIWSWGGTEEVPEEGPNWL